MACHIAEAFWNGSGPLFLYTGNEGPVESYYENCGFIFELAQEFKALVAFIEHVRELGFVLAFFFDNNFFIAIAFLWEHASLWTHRFI